MRLRQSLFRCLPLSVSLALISGCYGSSALDARSRADGGVSLLDELPDASVDMGRDASFELPPDFPPPTPGGSFPCRVGELLADRCSSCHGAFPSGGAPYALNTYAALFEPAPNHPGQRVIDRMVARMTEPERPMPPSGLLPSHEIDVMVAWRDEGAPGTGCSVDPMEPPPVVCSSNSFWTGGNDGSERMNPGRACIACHRQEDDGPLFAFAGTVYPTVREPDRCNGVHPSQYPGVQVEIIDANGTVHAVTPNNAGNFFRRRSEATVVFPIRARVRYEGRVREMATPQMSGDCNACHTQDGANGAPGRIRLP